MQTYSNSETKIEIARKMKNKKIKNGNIEMRKYNDDDQEYREDTEDMEDREDTEDNEDQEDRIVS